MGVDLEYLRDRFHVGIDVEVGQKHALRFTGTAAAEDNRHDIIEGRTIARPTGPLQDPNRRESSYEKGRDAGSHRDPGRDVFDPNW